MTVRVYRSSDSGAPTLSGTAGSLIAVLAACLVNGYGSQTASGWSMPYTGTNKAVFRQPATANQRYLYVDDTATTYASVTAYENMTSLSAGTGQFPTVLQVTNGMLFFPKANGSDAVARQWMCIATDKMFYLWLNTSSGAATYNGYQQLYGFGDFVSNVPGDQYNTILLANASSTYTSTGAGLTVSASLTATTSGAYVARGYSQVGESVNVSKPCDPRGGTSVAGSGGMVFPNPVDNKIYVAPFMIGELVSGTAYGFRGILPGIWNSLHASSSVYSDGDNITNIDGLTGKTLEVRYGINSGCILLETSNTW